jgi:hypothetical protein
VSTTREAGQVTGMKDKNYNLIGFTEKRLDNALRPGSRRLIPDGSGEIAEKLLVKRLS